MIFTRPEDSHTLAMEVLPILDVVDLGDEFFHQRIFSVELLERCADTSLQVVIRLLDLANVCSLKLIEEKSTIRIV